MIFILKNGFYFQISQRNKNYLLIQFSLNGITLRFFLNLLHFSIRFLLVWMFCNENKIEDIQSQSIQYIQYINFDFLIQEAGKNESFLLKGNIVFNVFRSLV